MSIISISSQPTDSTTADAADVNNQVNQIVTDYNGNITSDNVTSGFIDTILPSQTSNSGKFLTTDGTNSSWAAVTGSSTSFISAGEMSGGGATKATVGGVLYVEYADNSNDEAAGALMIPTGKTGISSIKVYYKNQSISTNVVIASRVYIFTPAAAETANSDTTATERVYATGSTNNNIEAITLNGDVFDGLSAFSAGQILNIEIKRMGASGSDTYGATFRVLGVLITWS